ncbi:MAG TPA: hypothetical protein VFC03_03775, partial [Acidimicrobiales bacterium]|nr:hypothetical protein [Acidimicrobiales bacterium]
TSNDSTVYSSKSRLRYFGALNQTVGGTAALGFQAFDAARPILPPGMKMRGVYVQDPSGGATRFVPVGSVTAPAWTGAASTVQVDYSGIGTMTDGNIIGRREERPRRIPHQITNLSDAS